MIKSSTYEDASIALVDFWMQLSKRKKGAWELERYLIKFFSPLATRASLTLQATEIDDTLMFNSIRCMVFHFRGKAAKNLLPDIELLERPFTERGNGEEYNAKRFIYGYVKCLEKAPDPNKGSERKRKNNPDKYHELLERYYVTLYEVLKGHAELLILPEISLETRNNYAH